ncbi:hypothetical protein ACH5RR_040939 [Cinchona calisaya]|uniref:non-specific serine/threonine protein kinase n=1 Tax=Cinchona calisaya TaxID=153742 RepID=A0ABD2XSM7_9GENT
MEAVAITIRTRTRTRFRLILLLLLCTLVFSQEDDPQATILLKFKESLNNATELDAWGKSENVCNGNTSNWKGLVCHNGEVTMLKLEGMGLHGSIDVDTLSQLHNLRSLSVMNNSFGGAFPDVKKLGGTLRALYLSFNSFSGEVPDDAFAGMNSIRRVVMRNNEFVGKIPTSLTELPRLVDLQLQNNQFNGEIPDFPQNGLKVNIANNKLEGPIPPHLQSQNPTSLEGNNLCGRPLDIPCPKKKSTLKTVIIIVIVIGVTLISILISILFFRQSQRKSSAYKKSAVQNLENRKPAHEANTKKVWVTDQHSENNKKNEQGNLYFVRNDRQQFELEDLLRASAEVLGSGNFGSSYKADILNGPSVVVKRFRQMTNVGKEQFFEHMRRLGKLSHPNLLPLVAFYYTKEEKLLVTDFAELGSLASHLHGKRSPNHPGLDWPTRLNIIKGVAKGLDYLYKELPILTLPHGHLKSSNVLLDKKFGAILADYSLAPVINKEHAQQFMVAYKSPEFTQHDRVTKKTDVWGLGILILELLTGRFPANYLKIVKGANADLATWVNSVVREEWTGEVFDKEMSATRNGEGQMLKLLKIGLCCCEWNMERRWDLREAVEKIEELKERDSDDQDYSSYGSEGDVYSSRGMTDDDFSFSMAEKSLNI